MKSWICLLGLLMGLTVGLRGETPYTTIAVDEHAGMARTAWPVQVAVPLYGEESTSKTLWLARVGEGETLTPVPFQVVDRILADPRVDWGARPPMQMVELVFLADLAADEEARFRLYYGKGLTNLPAAEPLQTLAVEVGEGLARTVSTGPAIFGFHDLSGQLLDYTWVANNERIHFTIPARKRPIHHNPDAWVLPESWTHASGWHVGEPEAAPEVKEISGPLMWRTIRTGEFPRVAGLEASVSYTAFAGSPYLLEASSMRFTRNLIVNAVRNNELVFSRGFQTHGVYIDHEGKSHTLRAYNPKDPDESFAHIAELTLPVDLPFIGLFHESRKDGMGAVTLSRYVHNPEGVANAAVNGGHYYFSDGNIHRLKENNFTYFTRAEIFNRTWGDEGKWSSVIIPAGSQFAETSVFLVFPVEVSESGEFTFEEAAHWTEMLRNPPRVWVQDGRDWRRRGR